MFARTRFALPFALFVAALSGVLACSPSTPDATPGEGPLAALAEASGWLGVSAAPTDSLPGHPVLLMAWSDTDPRCLKLLSVAQAWQQAYGRFGLRVVGVHVPEYAFAADSAVPARALRRLGVSLPVALDAGSRVGSRLGVGGELPLWIVVRSNGTRAFTARGNRIHAVEHALLGLIRRGRREPEPPPATTEPRSIPPRRVYCGTARVARGPLKGAASGTAQTFTVQFRYQEQGEPFTPYPVGRWTPAADGITSVRGGASDYLAIRYKGGRLDAVLGATAPMRVWVLCDDGWLPSAERGDDVRSDAGGATFVEVDVPRPYAIVRAGGAHVLRFSPEGAGLTVYEVAIGAE